MTLVKDIASKMVALRNDLQADQTVFRFLAEKEGEFVTEVVRMLLFHDLYHVLERINPEQDELKYFVMYYVVKALFDHVVDIPNELQTLQDYYDAGGRTEGRRFVEETAPNLQGLAGIIGIVGDNVVLNTKLVFPPFLKAHVPKLYETYRNNLHNFALILAKADPTICKQEKAILNILYTELSEPFTLKEVAPEAVVSVPEPVQPLEDILEEMNALIGLDGVKRAVNKLINFVRVQQARKQQGLKTAPISYHMVFTGNPGTGKTTIARIVSKLFKALGILSTGHLVKTDRSGLVAEDAGQTAAKVNKVVDSALDGVLFVDEAYALVSGGGADYGMEAVATLIKRMEDDRGRLVVIFADHAEEMKAFLVTNPGVQSRVNRYLHFDDYSVEELKAIFLAKCRKLDYHLTNDALEKLNTTLERSVQLKDYTFRNGRFVRNLFEQTLEHHANRIAGNDNLTKEILTSITAEDIIMN